MLNKFADCLEKTEVKFNSEPSNLAEARKYVADKAACCHFNDQEIFDIKLAVGEALANAVEHGSPKGSRNEITVTCYCNKNDLMIAVSDQGSFRKILPVGNSNDVDYRGRGILLMLALMDKVSIDESENGTTVYLTKRYHSANDECETC